MTSPRTNSTRLRLAQALLGTFMVSVFGLGVGLAPIHADTLDDKKDKIDQQVKNDQEDLEDLNATLAKAAAKLKDYQDRLPAAQSKLTTAQANVTKAQGEVQLLRKKLSTAQANKAKLDAERDKTEKNEQQSQQAAARLAAQAYRQGGMGGGSDLSVLLTSGSDATSLASSMEMASRALQSQNQVIASLREKGAEDQNSAARLASVEQDIADLKSQSETALQAQTKARDEAQSAKDEVDRLVSDTAAAQKTLQGQVTTAKAQLADSKTTQDEINKAIKERQERLKREAAERARKAAEEAKKKREAARKAAAEAKKEAAAKKRAAAAKKAAEAKRLEREADAAESKAAVAKDESTTSGTVTQSSWGLIIPSTGGYISSGFGWRPTPAGTIDYFGTGGYVHGGQDWGYHGQCGAPVKAAAAGRVEYAGWKSSHGIIVSIDHKLVKGHALTTNYNHLSKTAVKVGQRVEQGQILGYVGTTGNSTGCHLHFETIVDGAYTDPMKLLP